MISGILGKKIGMTQIFKKGKCIPVTLIKAGPCEVLQIKTPERDGYCAFQLGFENKKLKNATKAEIGHVKAHGVELPKRFIRELPAKEDILFPCILNKKLNERLEKKLNEKISKELKKRVDEKVEELKKEKGTKDIKKREIEKIEKKVKKELEEEAKKEIEKEVKEELKDALKEGKIINEGSIITVSALKKFKHVDITGTSKGRGFQGGMKRHGFRGGPKTHGQSDRHRAPGSIGCSATPSRVMKGKRMAGHMGAAKCTVQNLEIVEIDEEKNLLVVKGSVPGPKNGYLIIKRALKEIRKKK